MESTNTSLVSYDLLEVGKPMVVGGVEGVLGAVTSVGTAATHDVFSDGSCIATYNLDGNADDLSGSYNGTATNVTYGTGKLGNAGVFNGSSSYMVTPNNGLLGNSPRSMSAWVKTTSTGHQAIYVTGGADKVLTLWSMERKD